jgi:hypothetical protein
MRTLLNSAVEKEVIEGKEVDMNLLTYLAETHQAAVNKGKISEPISVMSDIDREIGCYGLSFCVHLSKENPQEYERLMRRREKIYQKIFPKPIS